LFRSLRQMVFMSMQFYHILLKCFELCTLRSDLAIILDWKKSQVSVTRVLDSFSKYIYICARVINWNEYDHIRHAIHPFLSCWFRVNWSCWETCCWGFSKGKITLWRFDGLANFHASISTSFNTYFLFWFITSNNCPIGFQDGN
jgi:hypothetical protein